MGPVNWLAVVIAGLAAAAVVAAGLRGGSGLLRLTAPLVAMVLAAAMLGHALARIGAEKLALKPQLYFMQSGGLALAFVIPAVWLALSRRGVPGMEIVREAAVLLAAYLVMGAVFLLLG